MAIPVTYQQIRSVATVDWKAMTHNWDLIINGVPEPLRGLVGVFGGQYGAINTSLTQISNLPNSNIGEGVLAGNIRGVPFHQVAGRESSVREINLVMNEFYDYRLFRFFEAWKSMAVNRFDFSQDLNAMIPNGISIVFKDTDRQTPRLTYNLFDTVCTKCSLGGEYGSEPNLATVQASLKCGFYTITKGSDDFTTNGLEDDQIDSDI